MRPLHAWSTPTSVPSRPIPSPRSSSPGHQIVAIARERVKTPHHISIINRGINKRDGRTHADMRSREGVYHQRRACLQNHRATR
ncbi:unnamed protein product [Mesocestoides corti]|uniref:Uncharacterized protein n=1 Tax=Mesocestoides corti TaxID=53468 RepID=A0A0R3UEH0_MESCO|nr:unnamed protein product [Mesocestoides corti]